MGQDLPYRLAEFPLNGSVLDIAVIVQQAGGHPQHIAVHGGHSDIKGDGCDGAGGVFPQSRQLFQRLKISRELPAVLLHQDAGGFFQVAGAAVIAKPLPQLQQLLLLHGSQRGDIRQGVGEPLEVCNTGLHPGLLQHDLRDPGAVGTGVFPPGEPAAVIVVPAQQQLRQGSGELLHGWPPPLWVNQALWEQ